MRVGVDASCWINQRGYGRFTRELLKAMIAEKGSSSTEYIFFIDSVSYQSCDFPEQVKTISVPAGRASTEAASSSSYRSPKDMLNMGRAASRENLDILFFPSIYTFFPTISKAKKVVAIHDVIPEMFPHLIFPNSRSRLFWKLKSWMALKQADLILTVSNYSKQGISEYLGVPPEEIVVTVEAADPIFRKVSFNDKYKEVLRRNKLSENDKYFLYVGGIGPHKNLDTLLDGFQLFRNRTGIDNAKLVIVGDFKNDAFWMDATIQKQAYSKGAKSEIVFTGYVNDDELPYLYSGAMALIIPSFSEGFGLPALEAMGCGTAVIGSETTSLPEIVGDAGLFFDPYQPEKLAACMKKIWKDPDLKERLQNKGLKRAKTFSWKSSAEIVLDAFNQLVN